ncbi:glycosyltransferase family 2 protein [Synechocystis sp. CACIAM 05]|jgi:glycosyltransferase involved in cell wall biosynthesis|uniref:glycosyltransferase family 2 protein n=1 Tax=Synechocystis sp. CACIAM 05 TaxID=1933929 RepID=UPI00138E92DB|nr:glycosyltransferase family 2 protein [Synechocystis sp. CACIAM 05]QHU98999.1 hypothetical protein BWK47_01850 [Synechocystis sp. CACIAM 05]
MSKPTVSILIPTYNRENLITETVQSALNQTYQDFEIIIVDNQSTDNTYQVCLDLAKTDPRIRVYQNEENIGPVRNWQRCVELANGEYAKILFSDDLIHPMFLEKTLNLFSDDVGFVFTSIALGNALNVVKRYECFWLFNLKIRSSKFVAFFIKKIINVHPGCAIFRTKDLSKNLLTTIESPGLSGFENHGAGVDILPFLLTAQECDTVAYEASPLAFFRGHNQSISVKMNSKSSSSLFMYYDQAKIWFVEKFDYMNLCKYMYIASWIDRMRKEDNNIDFCTSCKSYTTKPVDITWIKIFALFLEVKVLQVFIKSRNLLYFWILNFKFKNLYS